MNTKIYRQIRVGVTMFVAALVSISVVQDSYLLATIAVITGMLFLALVRKKYPTPVDERERSIREKAAHITYAIFAPTIGIGAFLMLLPTHGGLSAFNKGEFTYLDSLGIVFAYLALFLIALYAISYWFLNKKYGGTSHEE